MADERPVTQVRVVVHTAGAMSPTSQMSHNHWSIYLIVDGASSVRLNMAAKPGYITGELEIRRHQYILSNTAIKVWDFAVVSGVTVQHLINLVYHKRRHLYNMSGEVQAIAIGC